MALGICDALRDADFLADAVHEGLAGQGPLSDALVRYERRRNEATMADYHENIAAAKFTGMPAELLKLHAALRGNEGDTRRFIMAREGMKPPEEFFNAENLERILANPDADSVSLHRTTLLPELNHHTEAAENV